MRLAFRACLRFHARHRWQAILTLLGIAMGVAVVMAVDIANGSARRAFELSLEQVTGKASHAIYGGPAGVPEALFTKLRRDLGVHQSAPVVVDRVRVRGETYVLLGIDPLAEIALNRYGVGLAGEADSGGLWQEDTVLLSSSDARALALGKGDELPMTYRGRQRILNVAGTFRGVTGGSPQGLILTDIATAQELLNRLGVLDRIDLILEEREAARIAAWLPEALTLAASDERAASKRRMAETFHLNLTAMSLLALLVGGLLIYNTMTFSVVRRRRLWGLLRALGLTRAGTLAVVMLESLAMALVGTGLGLVLGVLLAQGLVDLVLRTVNDLYFTLTVGAFAVPTLALFKGVLLGFGVTLVAALLPALEAARTPPATAMTRSSLERRSQRLLPMMSIAGAVLLAAGWLLILADSRSLVLGFVALALLVFGFCALVPAALYLCTLGIGALLKPFTGTVARLVPRGIAAGLSRTGLAVAALSVAVAATLGMGTMVASFRVSLELWLEQTLAGDVYLSLSGPGSASAAPGLPPALIVDLKQLPGVADWQLRRQVDVETDGGPLTVVAVAGAGEGLSGFPLIDPDPGVRSRFAAGEGALISEALAFHRSLAPGDSLALRTAGGLRTLPILGLFRDYRSPEGFALLPLARYRQFWADRGLSGMVLHRADDVTGADFRQRVRSAVDAYPEAVRVTASAEIREASLAVFERTFTVTRVLRLLTVLVAFVGVFGALMLLQLERLRELAVMRATGMTRNQVGWLVLSQSGTMGLLAGLLALPLGLLMAHVLIHVINRRAFGWTLVETLPATAAVEGIILALVAALVAGIYPAWRAARTSPARVLREE